MNRRMILRLAAMVAVLAVASAARADWPNLTAKWDQFSSGIYPWGMASFLDNAGGDALTADDFLCSAPTPVKEIRFGGFSSSGEQITAFRITFWDDVPATPNAASHPGSILYDRTIGPADAGDPLKIGWQALANNKYIIDLSEADWFGQQGSATQPLIYWICIQGVMPMPVGSTAVFYWTAADRQLGSWGDDAVFSSSTFNVPPWSSWGWPSEDPAEGPDMYTGPLPSDWFGSADMAFSLMTPEPATMALLGLGTMVLTVRRRR
jgi:hypothetical protein